MKWRRRSVHQDLENCISLASFLSLSRGTLEEEGGEDTSKVAALQLTFLLLTQQEKVGTKNSINLPASSRQKNSDLIQRS